MSNKRALKDSKATIKLSTLEIKKLGGKWKSTSKKRRDKDDLKALEGGKWNIAFRDKYPQTVEDRMKAVEVAEKSIGKRGYHLFRNNCETWVNEVLRGIGYSVQANRAKKWISKLKCSEQPLAEDAILLILNNTKRKLKRNS